MFGIILKNYLFSMLEHKFHEDVKCRHEDLLLVCILEKAKFNGKDNFLPFEKCEIRYFVPFGRSPSGTLIINDSSLKFLFFNKI